MAEVETGLERLREAAAQFHTMFPAAECGWYGLEPGERRWRALQRLADTLLLASQQECLQYPATEWLNVKYVEGYGLMPAEDPRYSEVAGPRLAQLLLILNTMYNMIRDGTRITKRDLYYQHFTEFTNQREVDSLVGLAVTVMGVPRLLTGVVATSKGLVAGDLTYTDTSGVVVDCSLATEGQPIPADIMDCTDLQSGAQFILVVEKDAAFQRLLEEGVFHFLPSFVMITGKGVPDLSSRQLTRRLAVLLGIPVLILTDCDPYGLEIFLMYKFGSLSMVWSAEPLAVPSSHWLGLLPSDLGKLQIGEQSTKQHTLQDGKKIFDLSRREYLTYNQDLLQELQLMWELNRKAEIQQISEEREAGFLARTFLPWKIHESASFLGIGVLQ